MQALIVVESIFGNTRRVAEAVAAGLSAGLSARIVDVAEAPTAIGDEVDLLVVGAPTHAFGLTRPGTRRSAADSASGLGVAAADVGMREWLDHLSWRDRLPAATFDTKIGPLWVSGSAGRAAARRLQQLGFRVITKPQSFRVQGTSGPLVEGELERARHWGASLAEHCTDLARHSTPAGGN